VHKSEQSAAVQSDLGV